MKFAKLAKLYEELENTSSYNKQRQLLADFLKKTPAKIIDKVAYLTLGQISNAYSDVVIGMAGKMVLKSIAKASKNDLKTVTKTYHKTGDIGETAEQCAKGKGTTVTEVFDTLNKIAEMSGKGSQDDKITKLASLLKKTSPLESRYIARLVLGQLRLGVGDKTVLDALALAYANKKDKKTLEHAYNTTPDVGLIAKTLAKKGIKHIDDISTAIGIPLQSMLCQRIKNLETIEKKMDYPVAVEEKYDGERIQAHINGKNITLFSRRLDDITHQFPDVVTALKKAVKAKKCILDCEAMPVDNKGNYLPFQQLMQRRRKHDIKKYAKKIPVKLFVFDCLYYRKSLIKEPYKKRYNALKKILKQTTKVKLANRTLCKTVDCIEKLFNDVVQKGGEGVIIKNLDGTYQAGVRGWNWIKWKPEYVKGMRDTFDLVVVGAYHGRGRRAGTYGALLCAVYDKNNDTFETFCKLGSGFNDNELAKLPKKLKKDKKKPARVHVNNPMKPDIWIVPEHVAEVLGAEITKSPSHTSGYALRFPRFKQWRDKKPEQATTLNEIKQLVR